MGGGLYNKKGKIIMLCMSCGANAKKDFTTDVTDLGGRQAPVMFSLAACQWFL